MAVTIFSILYSLSIRYRVRTNWIHENHQLIILQQPLFVYLDINIFARISSFSCANLPSKIFPSMKKKYNALLYLLFYFP